MLICRIPFCVLAVCSGLTAAAAEDAAPSATPAAAEFLLPATDGSTVAFPGDSPPRLTVLCFLGVECPLANLYAPRLASLAAEFEPQGVRFVGINSNLQDAMPEVREYAAAHDLPFPVVKDYDHAAADQLQAERTPEVFVLDAERIVRYSGRIDDQYRPGVTRPSTSRHDLRVALEELLAGRPVTVASTEADGCVIGRKRESAIGADVTYCRDIARVLEQHCVECHRAGEIGPFSLTDYDEVVGWADTLLEAIDDGRMPPWHASPEHGDFTNARFVPDADKQALREWVAAGTPYGDVADLPASVPRPSDWRLSREPDLVLPMRDRPFAVPAEGTVEYQYYVVDPGFREDQWVTGAQVIPGNRSVLHHAIVFVRPPDGETFRGVGWLSGYVPGQRAAMLPEGYGQRIPAGSTLVFQMHYTPTGRPQEDLTKVGLLFGDEADITHEVFTLIALNQGFEIPPHMPDFAVEAQPDWLPEAGELLAIAPHMHYRGKAFQVRSRTGDRADVLLDVPRYDFNWQHVYELAKPLPLAGIDELEFTARFDNSAENPANPDPSQYVTWGDQTWEEMAVAFFEVAVPRNRPARSTPRRRAEVRPQTQPAGEVDEFVRQFFDRFDLNGDGEVDESEMPLSIQRFGFWQLDDDGNGRLTRQEIENAAKRRERFQPGS